MALVFADLVRETSTTEGVGAISLRGRVNAHQGFVAGVGNGNTCYYCIQHQTKDEREVVLGTVTDAATDTLSRDTVISSSNGGLAVSFSAGLKDVFAVNPQDIVAIAANVLSNLCLNPGFEVVLPGTHTAAIKDNTNDGDVNSQFPGWIHNTSNASADITIDTETGSTNISATGSGQSMKITVTNDSGKPKIFQRWDAGEFLAERAKSLRGRQFIVAADVKQSVGSSAAAIRLFITTDGTGGTTTFSAYHAANTDFERLLVNVLVPTDATDIEFGIEVDDTNGEAEDPFYWDNVMAVAVDQALTVLPYQPRLPIELKTTLDTALQSFSYSTPADTVFHVSGDGTADTDVDYNAARPAWASKVLFRCRLSGTGAGNGMFVKSNGFTNDQIQFNQAVTGQTDETPGEIDFGADSQFQFKVNNTNNTFTLTDQKWIGVGL